ncbi:MAG: hypothetical protein ABFS16_16225 [Bacteroidota bacterium]
MEKYFKILSLIMLLFLLTAEDCADNGELSREAEMTEMFNKIESEFRSDEPESELLDAFEKRAIQILVDLNDYLSLYSQKDIAPEFRKQANHLINGFFVKESDVQDFYKILNLKEDTVNSLLLYPEQIWTTTFDSVLISNRLVKNDNTTYLGEISFTQKEYSDSVLINSFNRQMELVLMKAEKQFGSKTEEVWEVYLGGVKN